MTGEILDTFLTLSNLNGLSLWKSEHLLIHLECLHLDLGVSLRLNEGFLSCFDLLLESVSSLFSYFLLMEGP